MKRFLAPVLLQAALLYPDPYTLQPRYVDPYTDPYTERFYPPESLLFEMRRMERQRQEYEQARDIMRQWDEEARQRQRDSWNPGWEYQR